MKYYVIYRDYTEYTQFEGEWNTYHKEFDHLQPAMDFVKTLPSDEYIAGPLKPV